MLWYLCHKMHTNMTGRIHYILIVVIKPKYLRFMFSMLNSKTINDHSSSLSGGNVLTKMLCCILTIFPGVGRPWGGEENRCLARSWLVGISGLNLVHSLTHPPELTTFLTSFGVFDPRTKSSPPLWIAKFSRRTKMTSYDAVNPWTKFDPPLWIRAKDIIVYQQ